MNIEEIEREIAKKKAVEKAVHDAELKRITDAHDKRMKAEEAERKRQIEAEDGRREAAYESELEEEAKALFYAGNGGAAPAIWQSVREEYRRLVMQRRAEAAARETHSLYKW
jgi:hypothetical protein